VFCVGRAPAHQTRERPPDATPNRHQRMGGPMSVYYSDDQVTLHVNTDQRALEYVRSLGAEVTA